MNTVATIGKRPIETYLAELRHRLPRGRSSRDVLAEVQDGLEDAAAAYRSGGMAGIDAEQRAVTEFGGADQISALIRTELGASSGFRAAIVVAIGYPLMLALWAKYYAMFGSEARWDNGEPGDVAFTVVGIAGFVLALLTCLWLRFRARAATRPQRPVVLGFALTALTTVLITCLLAVFTHEPPPSDQIQMITREVVQFLSLVIIAVMAFQITVSLKLVGLRRQVSYR